MNIDISIRIESQFSFQQLFVFSHFYSLFSFVCVLIIGKEITTKIRDNKNPNNPIVVVLQCSVAAQRGVYTHIHSFLSTTLRLSVYDDGEWMISCCCLLCLKTFFFTSSSFSYIFSPHSYFSVVCVYIHLKRETKQ